MIDAINNACCSLNHGGRCTNHKIYKSYVKPMLYASSGICGLSLLTDTIVNLGGNSKLNATMLKDITKNAGIWALITAGLFTLFNGLTHFSPES